MRSLGETFESVSLWVPCWHDSDGRGRRLSTRCEPWKAVRCLALALSLDLEGEIHRAVRHVLHITAKMLPYVFHLYHRAFISVFLGTFLAYLIVSV